MGLSTVLPEIVLLVAGCTVLLVDVYRGQRSVDVTFWTALVGLLATLGATLVVFPETPEYGFSGTVVNDPLSVVLRALTVAMGIFMFTYGREYFARTGTLKGEYYVLGMFVLLGAMVITVGANMLTLYLGLELLSLSMYALVAMERDSLAASEAAIKYFVLGAIASGMLLYGVSMIYGATGSLDLIEIAIAAESGDVNRQILTYGLVFVAIGIAFKLGVVPFHMWVPDVYQGAPTPITLFIGSIPKLASFALMFRILAEALAPLAEEWQDILYVLSLMSMIVGNLVAIAQTNVKRMLAYSTIAHMGFLLIGFLAATDGGFAAAMFYAVVYAFTSMAAFALVILVGTRDHDAQLLEDFAGLGRRSPWFGFVAIAIVFSLAGVPPFPGFWAKWFVIKEAVGVGFVTLAVVAVLASVVGAYYYLNLLKIVFFDDPGGRAAPEATPDFRLVLSVNAIIVLALGLSPDLLMQVCQRVTALY